MTALAAWCGPLSTPGADVSQERVARVLGALALRGDRPKTCSPAPGCALGAGVYQWQSEWVGTALGTCGAIHVVSDATLYYVGDLLRALGDAGVTPVSHTPADLIAAAVATWGDEATERLEGDYAFVAVDTARRRVIGVRDWGGLRSLYFALAGDSVAFASEPTALAQLSGVDGSLNLPFLAEAVTGRFESLHESAFNGVEVVPAGFLISVELGASRHAPRVDRIRQFTPPLFLGEERARVPYEVAKDELRDLMESAVRERIPRQGPVTVTLSGGRDSPAVYGLARRLEGDRIRSVSVSYPVGDPGREDEIILDVLRHCGGEPCFIDSQSIPVLGEVQQGAQSRPEPFGHAFAEFQESLARAARKQGAHVILNGSGGDQFFSGEPSYLADLLRGGRLHTLVREWRLLELGSDWRLFFKLAVVPNLGPRGRRFFSFLNGGKPWLDPFDHPLVPWLRPEFAKAAGLAERHERNFPSREASRSAADFERQWLLGHPFYPRVFAEAYRLYLKEGIELRAPLADRRLLRFAASRPRWERRMGWQMKTLMRASLTEVLPHSVTGSRPRPTGTTEALFDLAVKRNLRRLFEETNHLSSLSDLGVVDPDAYGRTLDRVLAEDGSDPATGAVYTILAEVWLKSRIGKGFPVVET
ncbi:MAG: asparagine synthase-related protein [Gemmatimonadaceae bacterium]